MLDLADIRQRAATRATAATPANAANLLTPPISSVAAVATVASHANGLELAIRRCCALRGDTPDQTEALVADSLRQSPEHQADLLAHFAIETARWRAACR